MVTVRAFTNEQHADVDPILWPFLTAADETAAEAALTALIAEQVEPRLREIVHYKLRSYAGRWAESEERADVSSEILVQLLTRLAELRIHPEQNHIRNFRSYVAVTAYRACYDYLRRQYPQRYSLKHKLRYTLTRCAEFGCWQLESDEWICGLAQWQQNDALSIGQMQRLQEQAPTFAQATLPRGSAVGLPLPDLLRAFFNWVGQPIELDSLVGILAELLSVKDQPREANGRTTVPTNAEAARDQLEQLPDHRASVVDALAESAYLKRLWQEIAQMTPRHCTALLLNLRDDDGNSAIDLFLFTGAASFQQIASAMAMTEPELAAIWNHLPLEDTAIAERLQLTRQQVINLRRSARERLARRMEQAGF